MSGTELRVLEIIWDWGGEASVDIIAREAGIRGLLALDFPKIKRED